MGLTKPLSSWKFYSGGEGQSQTDRDALSGIGVKVEGERES